jgi:hypothetical protein
VGPLVVALVVALAVAVGGQAAEEVVVVHRVLGGGEAVVGAPDPGVDLALNVVGVPDSIAKESLSRLSMNQDRPNT